MAIKIVVNGMPVESDNPSQLAEFVNSLNNKVERIEVPKKIGRPLGSKTHKKITHEEWSKDEIFYLLNHFSSNSKILANDPILSRHTYHGITGMKAKVKTGNDISVRVQKMIDEYQDLQREKIGDFSNRETE